MKKIIYKYPTEQTKPSPSDAAKIDTALQSPIAAVYIFVKTGPVFQLLNIILGYHKLVYL